MGIHNEAGHTRLSPIPTLSDLISRMLDLVMSTTDTDRAFLPFLNDGQDSVVVMINNLGGLSELELCGIAGETVKILQKKVHIRRVLSGSFMVSKLKEETTQILSDFLKTSLNMPGFSLSLFLLPREEESRCPASASKILSLLDEKVDVPGWKWSTAMIASPSSQTSNQTVHQPVALAKSGSAIRSPDAQGFIDAISRACKAVIAAEPDITRMDSLAGDGDCGLTLKAGAEGKLL